MFIRYAITDRSQYGKSEPENWAALIEQTDRLASQDVDFIQLREKDLAANQVIGLARGMISAIRGTGSHTRLLVNGRADIAIAAGADGVHLPSGEDQLRPAQVRELFEAAGRALPTVSISCHGVEDVVRAREAGADLVLFGPVFEKVVEGKLAVTGTGLAALRSACIAAGEIPILALGGITPANSAAALATGAAGIAAIRLFR